MQAAGKKNKIWRNFTGRVRSIPALRAALRAIGAGAAGFLLATVPFLGWHLPLALAFLAALPYGLPSYTAYLGAVCGYLLFWPFSEALEPIAAGFLILAGLALFHDFLQDKQGWFLRGGAAGLYLLISLIFLVSGDAEITNALVFLVRLALLLFCIPAMQDALNGKRSGKQVLALCLLAGTVQIPLFMELPLASILAVTMVCLGLGRQDDFLLAICCSLILDLGWQPLLPMTLTFCICAGICHLLPIHSHRLQSLCFVFLALSIILFSGGKSAIFVVSVILGASLAALIPVSIVERLCAKNSLQDLPRPVREVTDLLLQAGLMLDRTIQGEKDGAGAAIFDRATDAVCTACKKWDLCWNVHAAKTYRSLRDAAKPILVRGNAELSDFSASFCTSCCQPEMFLQAVNDALEHHLAALQYQSRLKETRAIISEQYCILSRFLQTIGSQNPQRLPQAVRYQPQVGFRAKGIHGSAISGDYGCEFTCGRYFYLLLCDGMGTGRSAGIEAGTAASFLKRLILSGMDAADSLQMLNTMLILRDAAGHTTVDLLRIDLCTAEGMLFKWGAAPSYLLTERGVKKIGTALPPPGLGIGQAHKAEQIGLSLQKGEVLVLASDGAATEAAEAYLRRSNLREPAFLADAIVAASEETGVGADDRTALALRLRHQSRQREHSIEDTKKRSKQRHISRETAKFG